MVLLAGCAGGSKDAPAAASSETISLGSLTGRVVDDEQVPVPGLPVQLVEPGLRVTTGVDGEFRFEAVVAGTHTVAIEAPGYEPLRERVDVKPDEVQSVTLVVSATATLEPYVEILPFEGYIQHGNEYLDVVTGTLGADGCEKCRFYFNASGDVVGLVSEIQFVRTLDNPHGPEVLAYGLFTQDLSKRYVPPNQYWPSGGKFEMGKRWGDAGERFVHTHGCDDLWICIDQTFTNYVSLFHVDPPPEGYTALPTK